MLVVVGGHSRNIGKTSVVCGIVAALRDLNWTAVKITQYGHGVCSHGGEPCECADPRHPVVATEEVRPSVENDSGRFLVAGARRSFWVRTPAGGLAEALPKIRRILDAAENTIIESNSLLQFLRPDYCLMVLDGAVEDFKPTSRRFLDRADAFAVTSAAPLRWKNVPGSLLEGKRRFDAFAPGYSNPELALAIRGLALKKVSENADSTFG